MASSQAALSSFGGVLQKMEEAAAKAALEEQRRKQTQLDLQDRYRLDLEREKMVTSVPLTTPDCVVTQFYVFFSPPKNRKRNVSGKR